MKKVINYFLAVFGLISFSNYSGAFNAVRMNTTFEPPAINHDHPASLDPVEQALFYILKGGLEDARDEEERKAYMITMSDMYGNIIFS